LFAGAQEVIGAIGGLTLCGGAATAVQIVALDLLQESFPEGKARVSAFTPFGMVYPAAFVVFPILIGGLLDVAVWRLIPLGWSAAGVVMAGVVMVLVRSTTAPRPLGEWLTLLLAGVALAAGVRFVDSLGRKGVMAPGTFIALVVLIADAGRARVLVGDAPQPARPQSGNPNQPATVSKRGTATSTSTRPGTTSARLRQRHYREGRRLQRRDHRAAPAPQAPNPPRPQDELLVVNAGWLPTGAQPECPRTTLTR